MNKPKTILGISAFYHDSTAALIHDGKVIAVAEEERFNHQKHTNLLPSSAVNYCLSTAGIRPEDVDEIAFYFSPYLCLKQYIIKNNPLSLIYDFRRWEELRFYFEAIWLANFWKDMASIKRRLKCHNAKFTYMPHTYCHIWYGIYDMPTENGVVLSNDSMGEYTGVCAVRVSSNIDDSGKRKSIKLNEVFSHPDPHSIGYLYGAITKYLGFRTGHHEGKVMALASFGDEAGSKEIYEHLKSCVSFLPDGQFRFSKDLVLERGYGHFSQRLGDKTLKLIPAPPTNPEKFEKQHHSLAHALQKLTNELMAHQIYGLQKSTGAKNFVHVGGVAQNSVANGYISDLYPDINLHIPPVPHDAGCALGAALQRYYQIYGDLPVKTETAFLGPEQTTQQIKQVLDNNGIVYREIGDVTQAATLLVDLLSSGKVIAVHDGRMECGPRALGHRSILADPRGEHMRDHLNKKVKFREEYRPYGAILTEDLAKIALNIRTENPDADYMSFVYDVKPDWKTKIRSLVHVDGTCRAQIVRKNHQPFLYQVLSLFHEKTGTPALINTSLNVRSQPICRTCDDSISALYTSALDGILFNKSLLVMKKDT